MSKRSIIVKTVVFLAVVAAMTGLIIYIYNPVKPEAPGKTPAKITGTGQLRDAKRAILNVGDRIEVSQKKPIIFGGCKNRNRLEFIAPIGGKGKSSEDYVRLSYNAKPGQTLSLLSRVLNVNSRRTAWSTDKSLTPEPLRITILSINPRRNTVTVAVHANSQEHEKRGKVQSHL